MALLAAVGVAVTMRGVGVRVAMRIWRGSGVGVPSIAACSVSSIECVAAAKTFGGSGVGVTTVTPGVGVSVMMKISGVGVRVVTVIVAIAVPVIVSVTTVVEVGGVVVVVSTC